MNSPISARRISRRVRLQVFTLFLAVTFVTVFHSRQLLASFIGFNYQGVNVQKPETLPLFSRQRHSFQVAVNILADAAEENGSPVIKTYHQDLLNRISAGRTIPVKSASDEAIDKLATVVKVDDNDGNIVGGEKVEKDDDGSPKLIKGDLQFEMNPEIESWVTFFTETDRGRKTMEVALQRSGKYLALSKEIFAREGLPTDLVFLAQAESTWVPKITSSAKARGLWQFMPDTGLDYGLSVDRYVDERSDPVRSTEASAQYLRDLHNLFNDWPLAMAAYNSGENRVMRSIVANGNPDFWELKSAGLLPKETSNYVPIILGIITVAKDYKAYGFDVNFDQPLKADSISLGGQVSLQLLADCSGTSLETIQELNPQFSLQTTAPVSAQIVYLPAGKSAETLKHLYQVPVDKRLTWRIHQAGTGEELSTIASTYRVSVDDIVAANNLTSRDTYPGQVLSVPVKAQTVIIPFSRSASRNTAVSRSYNRKRIIVKRRRS